MVLRALSALGAAPPATEKKIRRATTFWKGSIFHLLSSHHAEGLVNPKVHGLKNRN
jgi:hypothetical protein